MTDEDKNQMVLSYKTMRRFLGWLGLFLPLVLFLGGIIIESCLRTSISCFYYSECVLLHGIYLGTLCALGVFLVSYRGYAKLPGEWFSDNFITSTAGICVVAVAILPIEKDCLPSACSLVLDESNLAPWDFFGIESMKDVFVLLHYTSAAAFFIAVALMSLCMFTKGDPNGKTYRRQKCLRNLVYKICAIVIFACVALLVAQFALKGNPDVSSFVNKYKIVFWAEFLALWAFAFSWLTKGQKFFPDKKEDVFYHNECPSLRVLLCGNQKASSE